MSSDESYTEDDFYNDMMEIMNKAMSEGRFTPIYTLGVIESCKLIVFHQFGGHERDKC